MYDDFYMSVPLHRDRGYIRYIIVAPPFNVAVLLLKTVSPPNTTSLVFAKIAPVMTEGHVRDHERL